LPRLLPTWDCLKAGDNRQIPAYKNATTSRLGSEDSKTRMAVRRLSPDQPATFAFTPQNATWAQATIANYPPGKQASAVIPLLWRAQEQHGGWLPEPALRLVADMLGMAYIRVYEIATFYTMFQLSPVGRKGHVWVCGTTPCMLRGAEALVDVCRRRIHHDPHHLSADGDFSWEEVECLGVCANAPMVQIGKDTYEDLTPELLEKVLDGYAKGEPPKPGSQIGRQASCPQGGATTLEDFAKAGR
jgi:NADH-quinone oxidoreductase subunit E